MTRVKICGITDTEIAITCVESGADFLGFNFVKSSKRYCDQENAKKIIDAVKGINKKVKYVGVFQNEQIDVVNHLAKFLNLDYVQLHGEEDHNYIKQIKNKVIKTFFLTKDNEIQKIRITNEGKNIIYIMLDRKRQGEGEMVDVNLIKNINLKYPLFFAGGLTPENVTRVINEIKPFAVDVASGVETNGRKDKQKIKTFIQNAKLGGNQ